MGNQSHNIAAGVIISRENEVLLVRDKYGWTLPRGSSEPNESLHETAKREAREETGLEVEIVDVAFVVEFKTKEWGQYLQVYYNAKIIEGDDSTVPQDPDNDIFEVKYSHIRLEVPFGYRIICSTNKVVADKDNGVSFF